MPILKVSVSPELARAVATAARGHIARSRYLREVLEAAVEGSAPAKVSAPAFDVPSGRRIKVRVYLTPADAELVADEAIEMGMHRSSWIAALVHRRCAGAPRFKREDELSLFELHAEIGRLRRQIQSVIGSYQPIEREILDDVAGTLARHALALRRAVEGNLRYWSVDDE